MEKVIYTTKDAWGWTTTVQHDPSADGEGLSIMLFAQSDGDEDREMCMYEHEAIAAARAILKHFNVTLESD